MTTKCTPFSSFFPSFRKDTDCNLSVTQYLDGTTQNVLVTTSNTTMASDRRIYQSDGNQTMRRLVTCQFHPRK
jgi:hypothetical protein